MLKADNLGLYFGACSEYCGAEHAWMLIRVLVQPQASFDSWLAAQKQIPAPPTDPAARRGLQVFFNNPCATCHTIAGTAANGQNGPNLTHLGSRRTLGTGILVNTPANLRRWIKDAPAVKPGVQMPSYHQLSDQDINDLAAYLESLK
jgi:cytochrome c oxidase subunit 2